MADVKWIKITTDIFDDEKILLIESLPDSYAIITVWFKLLCLAGKQNNSGVFMMGRIAYTDKMLATIFRMKETTVTMALRTFEEFGMVEIVDGVITIPNWDKHQSLDSYEKKKERDRLYQQQRREKQRLLAGGNSLSASGLPLDDWQKVLKEFDHQCAYCGNTEGLEQEHIVPFNKGGKYELGNIVPACRRCNASKKDKPLIAWYSLSDVFNPDRLHHILEYMKSHDKSPDVSPDKSPDVAISEEDKEKESDNRNIDNISYQQIVDMYHAICISFPKIRSVTDARKKAIKARLSKYPIETFKELFEKAEASSFLKGDDGGWKASFDWLIKEANMIKVLEGNYTDKPKRYGRKETVPAWMATGQRELDQGESDAIRRMMEGEAEDPAFEAQAEAMRQKMQEKYGKAAI